MIQGRAVSRLCIDKHRKHTGALMIPKISSTFPIAVLFSRKI